MGEGNYSLLHTLVFEEPSSSTVRNNEHQNHINNCNPDGVDDASATLEEMRALKNPYLSSNPVLATSLRQELEGIRFQLKGIIGKDQWYKPPEFNLETGSVTGGDDHDHSDDPIVGGGAQIPEEGLLDNAVSTDKIQDAAVTTDKIQDAAVTPEKLAINSKNNIVNQQVYQDFSNGDTSTNVQMNIASMPVISQGMHIHSVNYTPVLQDFSLLVEADTLIWDAAIIIVILAMFQDTGTNAVAATVGTAQKKIFLSHMINITGHTLGQPINFQVRGGCKQSSAHLYYNETNDDSDLFGTKQATTIKITEFLP